MARIAPQQGSITSHRKVTRLSALRRPEPARTDPAAQIPALFDDTAVVIVALC